MGAEGVTQQELGLVGEFCWPDKFRVGNRGTFGVGFFIWAPIFCYWGSIRGPAGVALRAPPVFFFTKRTVGEVPTVLKISLIN